VDLADGRARENNTVRDAERGNKFPIPTGFEAIEDSGCFPCSSELINHLLSKMEKYWPFKNGKILARNTRQLSIYGDAAGDVKQRRQNFFASSLDRWSDTFLHEKIGGLLLIFMRK
jgi:hypothetical protein